jgi:DNA invertase Pin-like site-specific DNA recombinase
MPKVQEHAPQASWKLNPQQAELAKRLLNEGKLVSEIAETFGVHVATIYRLGAELLNGQAGLSVRFCSNT